MFIYNGKFTCQNASNETITVVFPAGFELNDPVSAYWQWSNDPKLENKKTSVANVSVFLQRDRSPPYIPIPVVRIHPHRHQDPRR